MRVFIAHSSLDRDLAGALSALLQADGHVVLLPMEVIGSGDLLSDISAAIRSADLFIAIARSGNMNVVYELGLAAGAGVPALVTAPGGERMPADLASVPYVRLTGDVPWDAQAIARRTNELRRASQTRPARFESAEATLRAATRSPAVLESLSACHFERLVMELFRGRGYSVAVAGAANEAGADFRIELPGRAVRVLVQVKKLNSQSRVSVETVRRFIAVVSAAGAVAQLGMLVAVPGCTAAALALAAGTSVRLRTLEEVLDARSLEHLLGPEQVGG